MKITTLAEAREMRLKHYYTGIACKRGHFSKRHVSDRSCLACKNEYGIAWNADNKDKKADYDKRYGLKNRKKKNEYMKEWGRKNPEKIRMNDRIQKQRRRAGGSLLACDVTVIVRRQKWKCAEPTCGTSIKMGYHMDHIMPVALGGKTEKNNMQALCPSCNHRKSAKHPIDWAKEKGRLL